MAINFLINGNDTVERTVVPLHLNVERAAVGGHFHERSQDGVARKLSPKSNALSNPPPPFPTLGGQHLHSELFASEIAGMTPATAAGALYGLTRGDSTPSSFHPFGFCSSLATSRLLVPRQLVGRSLKQARRFPSFRASFLSGKEDFEVGRFIGSYGFMNVTR